jgi:diguanylate cyclase (GGDEF)-like protein
MTVDVFGSEAKKPPVPHGFVVYSVLTAGAAAAALVVFPLGREWRVDAPALFWMLSLFVLVGELMPISVPRRRGLDRVTISTAFAFATLLRFGAGPATLFYVASSVIADGLVHVAPIKVLFNAAEYALSMLAAAGMLVLLASLPLAQTTGGNVAAVLAAAATFFLVNHVLACAAGALLTALPLAGYLRDDFAFHICTSGCLLMFAPVVLASADSSLVLVPVSFLPMMAIYLGGRQVAINSDRAYHDALTKLPNRWALAKSLEAAMTASENEGRSLAVMILDLDDFKAINDTLGHEVGDLVLKHIAQRLRHALPDCETLARLGGDEFAVVVAGSRTEAEDAAKRLLSALDHPLEVDSLALQVAASIGIACFPQDGSTTAEMLRHADVALYCAKASGAAFQTYAEEDDEYSIDRLALAAQLRRGIERGELIVHFQPKVALRGPGPPGVEALVRWQHPQLGCIGPDGFIPLAEQTGIIKPLTEWVLESTLRQCARWKREHLDVSVSVNVSTRNLLDHDLPAMILRLLERFELDPSVLQLEITESRTVADLLRARATLGELRSTGVMIAIDDFGTGYSSLSQLQQLPIDEIKIDRSFVMRMESHRSDAMLVRSIIDLGRNLGLRVTAEGVETEGILRELCQLGCDFAQGYHIGRPAVADECRRYLEASEQSPAVLLAVGHSNDGEAA